MNYEVKQIANGDKRNNGDGSWTVPLTVVVGIVGDTYGFARTGQTSVVTLDTDTGTEMDAKAVAAASAYVVATYPNT